MERGVKTVSAATATLALLALGSLFFYALRLGIGPVPTSRRVLREIEALLPSRVEGLTYELGCGWGGLLARLRRFGAIGVELSPLPVLVSSFRGRVVRQDLFEVELREAGLVVCYLYRGGMERLARKLERELPEGAIVITHTFALPGWEPEEVRIATDLYRTPVYRYHHVPEGLNRHECDFRGSHAPECRETPPSSHTPR
jgi:hypothetical protein